MVFAPKPEAPLRSLLPPFWVFRFRPRTASQVRSLVLGPHSVPVRYAGALQATSSGPGSSRFRPPQLLPPSRTGSVSRFFDKNRKRYNHAISSVPLAGWLCCVSQTLDWILNQMVEI